MSYSWAYRKSASMTGVACRVAAWANGVPVPLAGIDTGTAAATVQASTTGQRLSRGFMRKKPPSRGGTVGWVSHNAYGAPSSKHSAPCYTLRQGTVRAEPQVAGSALQRRGSHTAKLS